MTNAEHIDAAIHGLIDAGFELPETFGRILLGRSRRFPGNADELLSVFVLECYDDEHVSSPPVLSERDTFRILDRVIKRFVRQWRPLELSIDPEARSWTGTEELWEVIQAELDPQDALIADLYLLQQRTLREIADQTGCSIATSSRRVTAIRDRLRRVLS